MVSGKELVVGEFARIHPKSEFAERMVAEYGPRCRVGKIGEEHVMFTNPACTSLEDDTFVWGFWLGFHQADFELAPVATATDVTPRGSV